MKQLKHFILLATVSVMLSCGQSTSKQTANKEGFTAIENELKNKFGQKAYYTNLSVAHNATIGNTINVTVTKDPASLKMEEWNAIQDNWQQSSDISIEVPKGTKAADYMFQLGDKISLSQLGHLVEVSAKNLKEDKNLNSPTLSMASIQFPDNGDMSKAEYLVNLKPQNGGTTFTFLYNLKGDLIKMDY